MLDSDLAKLYGVNTSALNQAVRRNISRFPDDFMFQLSKTEYEDLRSQNVIFKSNIRKYLPNAFTEQGVAMLSSVLKSDRAAQVNVAIMRTFVKIRAVLSLNKSIARKVTELCEKVDMHDKAIAFIVEEIQEIAAMPEKKGKIGFKTPKKK